MNLKKIIFGVAIMILTIFVSVYGISIFYPSPNYKDFCPIQKFPTSVDKTNETICPAVCIPLYELKNGKCVFNECSSGCGADGKITFNTLNQCEIVASGKVCRDVYENAKETRAKKVFYIALPLGILILLIGGFIFHIEAIGTGLMGGGTGTIVYGAGNYWEYGDNLFKFIISLLGLIFIISVIYWFEKKKKF